MNRRTSEEGNGKPSITVLMTFVILGFDSPDGQGEKENHWACTPSTH